ncbi:MAG: uroporphyrinogen-III synthase, partial [Clostridium sp.]
SLHIITGHLKDESYGINFKALASLNGTLVFLMGISALETITGSLISEGMDENTPCAVVESGTTSNQRVTISTLKGIKDEAKRVKIKSPGIIIVGDVCSLAKEYSWIENMPLFGTRILVTRPKEVASKLSTILEKRGASVTSINTISIDKIDRKGFLYAASNISDYKWAIFTSPSGVNEFFNCLKEEELDIRILYGVKIAAVGPSTAKSIESRGLIVDFIPSRYDGETLGKEIGDIDSCILFRAAKGNEEVVKILEARGVKCLDTPIYKTSSVKQNINVEDYDYITFTSKSCIEGFVESTGLDDYSNINAICIGETTARLGRSLSMNVYVSEKATLESMANLLEKIRRDNNGLKG